MATYKQRVPVQRIHSGRHSPDTSKDSTTISTSGQYAHLATSQHQYFSAHQSLSSVYHNPDDDILDNVLDQEWTSIRRSADTESRAAYRRRMLEQRIQDWHLVLDQHRLNSSYQSDSSSAEEETKDEENKVSDTLPPTTVGTDGDTPRASAFPPLLPVNTSVPITASVAPSAIASPSAATHTSGSHFAFSDLASDSIGDESDSLEPWSPDDDDTVSTISRYRRLSLRAGVVPSSPTASQSSIASFGQLPHPSFYHGGSYANLSSPALRFQNRMPFHDGSGNFVTHRLQSRSHTGSELDSDQGGWESAVSSSKVRSISSSTTRRTKRGGLITPGDFESMLQSIASLQVQQQQQECSGSEQPPAIPRPYSFRPLARDGMALRSRWPRSPSATSSTRSAAKSRGAQPSRRQQQCAPTPRRPSSLQVQKACKSYDSDNEDLSKLVATIPSKTGWLQAFEQTLQSLNVKHASELNLNETPSVLNPIMALAQHPAEELSDLTGLAKTLVPEEVFTYGHEEEEGLRSMNATPTPASMRRKAGRAEEEAVPQGSQKGGVLARTDEEEQAKLRTVQKHISASSLETLQRLQDRQRAADYRARPVSDRGRRRMRRSSLGSAVSTESRDPLQGIEFVPTLRVACKQEATMEDEGRAAGCSRWHQKSSTNEGGQANNDEYEDSSERDTTLFRAFASTLRRFRDHRSWD
ncbi:hypothetical protein BGZ73_006238 [Actinomortierella ambigua]|nr:hypothetical protein BGZ73_006238 [Actinomortierella ambigua]